MSQYECSCVCGHRLGPFVFDQFSQLARWATKDGRTLAVVFHYWLGDELKVRVIAVPEKGKANTAVVKVLAMALGIANSDIKLLSGATFQHKTFEINGLEDTVIAKLMSADLT